MSRAASNSNGGAGEWQTAGKQKPAKPKSAQPKIEPTPIDTIMPSKQMDGAGDAVVVNGHAATASNGSATAVNHNGSFQNGGTSNGSRRGRRPLAANYGGKPQQHAAAIQSPRASNSKEEPMSKRKQLEKEVKNIAKHDAAVERAGRLFDEEMEKSRTRLRHAFNELRERLSERERLMTDELERCKTEGLQLLHQREARAKEFKTASERAATMTDRHISELRDQIRRFLAERRFEDELGRTLRFKYEPDRLIDLINGFGQVTPVRDPQKHSSLSSLVSSVDEDGVASENGSKSVNQIALGGIVIKSDNMDAEQLAQLTRQIQESLKLQGIAEDILPDVSGSTGLMSARRRPPPSDNYNHNGNGSRNGPRYGGGGQRRGGGASSARY